MPQGFPKKVSILQSDPRLGANLDPATRQRAAVELVAEVLILQPGEWHPPQVAPERGHLGLFVLEGLLSRQLEVEGARCVELLSAGDLLRPWQEDAASFVRARWRVLQRARAASLSAALAARFCRYPPLVEALVERTMNRSRSLAVFSAIDNLVGVENRLQLLL